MTVYINLLDVDLGFVAIISFLLFFFNYFVTFFIVIASKKNKQALSFDLDDSSFSSPFQVHYTNSENKMIMKIR